MKMYDNELYDDVENSAVQQITHPESFGGQLFEGLATIVNRLDDLLLKNKFHVAAENAS